MMLGFLNAARKDGREDIVAGLNQGRQFLARIRAEQKSPERVSGGSSLQAELREALGDPPQPGDVAELHRRIGLLRELLARPEVERAGELRAGLRALLGWCLVNLEEQASEEELDDAVTIFEAARIAHDTTATRSLWLGDLVFLGKAYARRAERTGGMDLESAIDRFGEVLNFPDGELAGPHLAEAGLGLAHAYLERQSGDMSANIELAIQCCDRVLATSQAAATDVQAAFARRMAGRAYLRRFKGRFDENTERAIGYLTDAATIFTPQAHQERWLDLSLDLGKAFGERTAGDRRENIMKAIEYLASVAEFQAPVPSPRMRAVALNGLATVYAGRLDGDRQRNLETAIDYYRLASEALASHEGFQAEQAAVWHGLGYAYLKLLSGNLADNVERAIGLFERALAVRLQTAHPLERARTEHALGNAYLWRRYGDRAHNVDQAISMFGQAETVFETYGAERELAATRQSLAQAYSVRVVGDRDENLDKATGYLGPALAAFADQGMIVDQAAALTALGNLRSEQEASSEAVSCHQRAIQLLGDGSARPDLWALVHNNLGTVYLEDRQRTAADLTAAITSFNQALTAGATFRSPVEQAMTRHNLGLAHVARADQSPEHDVQDLTIAIGCFRAALESFDAAGLAFYRRATGKELGDACARLGDHWPGALAAYQVALQAADDLYRSSLQREAKEAELATTPGLHRRAAYAAARAGQLDEAVAILELGRARGTSEAVARDTAELTLVTAGNRRLAEEYVAAANEIRELEAPGWQPDGQPSADGPLTGQAGSLSGVAARQQLEAARARLDRAIDNIRRLPRHKHFLKRPEFDDVARVARKAGPLAYLAVTDYGSLTLLVAETADGAGVVTQLIPEPANPLTSTILRAHLVHGDGTAPSGGYLPALLNPPGTFERSFRSELGGLLPVLGDYLAGPLARHLTARSADCVTLIACGILGLLPLHAATYQRDGETAHRYLLEDFTVSYAPSAGVLGAAYDSLPAVDDELELVLTGVGDPGADGSLPYARAELQQAAGLFPIARTRYGAEATKKALLDSIPGASHVHLACHGHFDPGSPRTSAVKLAGPEGSGSLTLAELIANRTFSGVRLVVASACESALIDFLDLADEAIGLPSGFLQAGSAGVVGTLWPILDISTALLMSRFYEYLLGDECSRQAGPAQALRLAQLWLARISNRELELYLDQHEFLRDVSERHSAILPDRRRYADPLYWAAFTFVGANLGLSHSGLRELTP